MPKMASPLAHGTASNYVLSDAAASPAASPSHSAGAIPQEQSKMLAGMLAKLPELDLGEMSRVKSCFSAVLGEGRENIVNALELRVVLGELGLYPSETELNLILRAYRDRVNLVTLTQYLRLYKKEAGAFGVGGGKDEDTLKAFVALGGEEDGSGEILASTLRDAIRGFGLTIDIDSMIRTVDVHHSGVLDYVDFCALWSQPTSTSSESGEAGGAGVSMGEALLRGSVDNAGSDAYRRRSSDGSAMSDTHQRLMSLLAATPRLTSLAGGVLRRRSQTMAQAPEQASTSPRARRCSPGGTQFSQNTNSRATTAACGPRAGGTGNGRGSDGATACNSILTPPPTPITDEEHMLLVEMYLFPEKYKTVRRAPRFAAASGGSPPAHGAAGREAAQHSGSLYQKRLSRPSVSGSRSRSRRQARGLGNTSGGASAIRATSNTAGRRCKSSAAGGADGGGAAADFFPPKSSNVYRPPSPMILSMRNSTAYRNRLKRLEEQKRERKGNSNGISNNGAYEAPCSSKTDTGAATEAKTSTTAAAGASSSTGVVKAKSSYRELCRPTSGAGGSRLSGTSWARLTTTRRVSRTTEALRPPPLVLHATENDASSGQGTTVATTEGATAATVESGHPRVHNRSITSTEDLQLAVARERVRALITRALHLWHLHRALRRHGRQHGDRETADGVEGRRETPSPTSRVGQRRQGKPSASRLAWTPLGDVGIGVRCGGIASDEGTVYIDADGEEELHDVDDGAEVPRHTELQRCQQQRHHRGRRTTDGDSSLSDAGAHVDGAYDRVDNPGTSTRPLAPASRSSVAPVIGAASRATSIVPPLSALSNASQSQSLARDMSFTSVRWSMSCPFQTPLQPQRQDELCSTSFPQTPVAASVPESRTADGAGVSLSVGAAALAEAAAGSLGSAGATGTTVTAEAAAERRKRIVQNPLSSKSPRNASPHQCLHNWLSSGVGGGSTSSFDDSGSRPQSCLQSDREAIAAQGGPPLCLRRLRSGAGGGAGLIASDSEDRSISSLINTPQGRQTDAASSCSGAWGPLKDGDSTHSDSTSPMPTVTATTVPQLLAREAEDRLALQTTEERRRLRLQRGMSAVMDQLMMAALHHRSGERGLHPSLRTSTAPSPVLLESDDGCGMDFLCACTAETQNEGTTRGSAGAIEPAASAREPRPSLPPPVLQAATSRRTQQRLNYDGDVECTQQHLQRSGRIEGEEGCLCDVTAKNAERCVSRDSAEAVDMATSPSKCSSQTLGSTSQWGAHVLDAVTITTDSHSSVVFPVTSIAPTSHFTPC
ncbi:hypothetical protein CGC20_4490 [Leishmania donovani]|uniref:EF-hand domain-containing protein n=1 Tax=Leishmania donovani TaxID=5661 RepID=A0A504XK34_LEIDO|nr:hypothetical protein CGC20_4490 [Leishmania donovani]